MNSKKTPGEEDDFVGNLGMEIDDGEDSDEDEADFEPIAEETEPPPEPQPPVAALSEELVEAAVAKVSEEYISRRIEALVAGAVASERDQAAEAISDERIEAAVARILEERFSERIEALMVDAVEKAVEKELARIRSILLGSEGSDEDA